MKKLLIIIPVRSGSTRVKEKNTKKFFNTSLLNLKINECLKIKSADLIVSTNSKKAVKICDKNNINYFFRSKKFASSKATMISAVLELIRNLRTSNYKLPEYIGVFPVTYPFVKKKTIIDALKFLEKNSNFNSLCSFSESALHPYDFVEVKNKMNFNMVKINDKGSLSFERTQDFPALKVLSGAIRITKTKYFLRYIKNKSYLFSKTVQDVKSCLGFKITKKEAFDINTNHDFEHLKKIFKNKNFLIL